MKKIALFCIAIAALGCTQITKQEALASNIFLAQKVGDFVAQHPEWTSGESINDEITDKFQHEIKRLSNEPEFLKEMPLQLSSLRDTLLNGTAFKVGTFIAYNDNTRPKGSILNYIQIAIDGILPPEIDKQVKIDGKYHIDGMLYRQGSRKDVKLISVADFKGYDLGRYLFSVTKVTPM